MKQLVATRCVLLGAAARSAAGRSPQPKKAADRRGDPKKTRPPIRTQIRRRRSVRRRRRPAIRPPVRRRTRRSTVAPYACRRAKAASPNDAPGDSRARRPRRSHGRAGPARGAAPRRLAALRSRRQNPIAVRLVSPDGHPQRAWFYMIPAKGEPVALVHSSERAASIKLARQEAHVSRLSRSRQAAQARC